MTTKLITISYNNRHGSRSWVSTVNRNLEPITGASDKQDAMLFNYVEAIAVCKKLSLLDWNSDPQARIKFDNWIDNILPMIYDKSL